MYLKFKGDMLSKSRKSYLAQTNRIFNWRILQYVKSSYLIKVQGMNDKLLDFIQHYAKVNKFDNPINHR